MTRRGHQRQRQARQQRRNRTTHRRNHHHDFHSERLDAITGLEGLARMDDSGRLAVITGVLPVWVLSSIPAPRMWNEETRSYHIVWKLTDKGRDVIKELEQQRN